MTSEQLATKFCDELKATNKKTNEPELSAIADHDAIAFIYGFLACSTRGDPKIIVTDFHVFK